MNSIRRSVLPLMLSACLLAAALVTAGCSKINQDNYNRLEVGMTYGEVISILGQAEECSSAVSLKNCTWGNKAKSINIKFAGEKVIFFSGVGLK